MMIIIQIGTMMRFVFGAVGGAVPLLPHPVLVPGLGSAERDGPAHLAEEAHLLALHLDLWGQHAGQEPLGFVFRD